MDCGTILIVDHDDASRLAAVRVAVRLGYEACAVENAELLLERLDGDRPALAIVEVELPGRRAGSSCCESSTGGSATTSR